jgi:Tol biopolymer transport system component
LLALLAVLIVVTLVSILAGRYYHGSLIQSPSPSLSAESSVSGMSAAPKENTTTDEATKKYECPGYSTCGTKGDDSLRGTAEAEYIEGLKGNDTLEGLGGQDYLYGSDSYLYDPGERGNDTLLGGPGYDQLYGEQGDDTLNGGPGPDWYNFEQSWGKDALVDSTLPAPSDIKRDTEGNPVVVKYQDRVDLLNFQLVTEDLSIDLTSDSGPKPEVSDPSATNTVNLDGNVIENVSGGGGDDTIKGNGSANSISVIGGIAPPPNGADTVFGGGGDDYISAEDGEENDTLDCGEGTDIALHDPGDTVSANCEYHGSATFLFPLQADASDGGSGNAETLHDAKGKIAFEHPETKSSDIYVINADGTGLMSGPTREYEGDYETNKGRPTWSPDGKSIAFVIEGDIYVANADGTRLTRLTNSKAIEDTPDWSPDGKKIAFTIGDLYDDQAICVMNSDGSNRTKLEGTPALDDADPTWSPDGEKIAFTSKGDIYKMDADGSDVIRLTNTKGTEGAPAWSPDGEKIAFSGESFGHFDIYVMNSDGTDRTRLTDTESGEFVSATDEGSPTWSPDGKKIAFTKGSIYVMNADGTGETSLNDSDATAANSLDWVAGR